jgi:hypothetical protein
MYPFIEATRRRISPLHWVDVLTILVLFAAAGLFARTAATTGRRGPERVKAVEGTLIHAQGRAEPSEGLSAREPVATVVYSFLTTCPACVAQHGRIKDALIALTDSGYGVVTLSPEPDSLTRDYWGDGMPAPRRTSAPLREIVGIAEVPSLVVVDTDGRVLRAFSGYIRKWDETNIVRAVLRASPE